MFLPPPPPPAVTTLEQDISAWQVVKDRLAADKVLEMKLRTTVAARAFDSFKLPNGCFPDGTTNTVIQGTGGDYKAKLKASTTYTILEEVMETTIAEAQLTPAELTGLVRRAKPELGLTAYKALSDAKRAIVDKMLLSKQGAVELTVEPLPK